jgi:hypothetical protein
VGEGVEVFRNQGGLNSTPPELDHIDSKRMLICVEMSKGRKSCNGARNRGVAKQMQTMEKLPPHCGREREAIYGATKVTAPQQRR